MPVYVESVKNSAIRFEVLEYDKESKLGKLKGGFGTVISRNISKPELERLGYKLIQSETALPLTPPPKGKGEAPPEE